MNPLLFSLIFLTFFAAHHSCAGSAHRFRGLSPEDEIYYRSKGVFNCRDASKKFTSSQLNDDYCDCADATDEPGTSACPNGKFYCYNAGHIPASIFSSRVNDGICDCCDGSDEYDGKVICTNTCWEAGRIARDNLKRKIETYKAGLILRKEIVYQANIAFSKDEEELSKRKSEEKVLKGIVQKLKDQKELIEKAELEREKDKIKEQELKTKKDQLQNETKVEKVDDGNIGDAQQNDIITREGINNLKNSFLEEIESAKNELLVDRGNMEASFIEKDNEDLMGEDLRNPVDSGWTEENGKETTEAHDVDNDHGGDHTGFNEEDDDHNNDQTYPNDDHHNKDQAYPNDDDDDDIPETDEDPSSNGDGSEDEIDNFVDADEDFSSHTPNSDDDDLDHYSDITKPVNHTWVEKIQQVVQNILQAVKLFKAPVDISDAAHIRDEYDKSNTMLSKLESRISSLTQKQKLDYGLHKELYTFYDQCFEKKHNNYVYKVCPFKEATQSEGHRSTRLGQWDKFDQSLQLMTFSGGDGCWNGPDRSLKVKVRCGLKNEIADVDEPSRCEYIALFLSPVGCTEEKLKELEEKLVGMEVGGERRGDDEL